MRAIPGLLTLLTLAGASGAAAQTGVTVQQHTTFNVARITSGDLTETLSILGTDRARTVTTGKTKILIISSDVSGTELTRLDRDSVYRLNDKKKEYRAQSLADVRADLQKQQKQVASQATELKSGDDIRYTVSVDEAKRTGEKQTINGFATERALVKLTVTAENTRTGEKGVALHITADAWLDPSQQEAAQAVLAFRTAQQQALGVEPAFAGNPYARWLVNVHAEMARLAGYPIRTTITFEVPKDSSAAAAKKDESRPPTSVQGAVLGAMFGGGKKKEPEPAAPNGGVIVFTATTEVTSIALRGVTAADFELPAGYVRK